MFINEKMRHVETTPGMRGGEDEFNMIYFIYCKNFFKCTMYLLPTQQ
jgi:hypothetical protein